MSVRLSGQSSRLSASLCPAKDTLTESIGAVQLVGCDADPLLALISEAEKQTCMCSARPDRAIV